MQTREHKHGVNVKKVDRLSGTKVRMTVQMPEDTIQSHEKALTQKYARSAKIPGFRPGKAPVEMVKKMYKDTIRQDLLSHLIEAGLTEALHSSNLMPLGRPELKLGNYNEGKPLEFEAEFEIAPEIELRNYKEIPLTEGDSSVTDKEIDNTLQNLRERLAVLEPLSSKKPEKGDFAITDLTIEVHDKTSKKEGPRPYTLEVGMGKLPPNLEKVLLEMQVGETRTVEENFPGDYPDKVMAGKRATFECKLNELKKKVLPNLDDSFASQVREGMTLEALRHEIRDTLETEKKEEANRKHRQDVVEYLIKNHKFEVPAVMVEEQTASLAQWVEKDLKARGTHPGKFSDEDMKGLKVRAENMVRSSLLLREVAVKEKISLDEGRVKNRLDGIAKQLNRTPEETEKFLKGNGSLDRLRDEVITDQVFEFLIRSASLKKAPQKAEKAAQKQ